MREFFETYFPPTQFKPVGKFWYETVRAAPIICAPAPGVNPGTIGTAFDYRARLCWAPIDWKTTVAAGGMMNVFGLGRADLGMLALSLADELGRIAPERCADGLDDDAEERVCRCSYALALYEQFFRSSAAAASSPLLQLGKKARLDDVLALAPQAAVGDLAAMARLLCERHPELIRKPAIHNPRFDGSVEIGGADADVIVEEMLLELKTTKKDSFERVDHLYQLLGYVLLDYTNQYDLDAVGIYLARRGVLVKWAIGDLVDACCANANWASAREAFREAVSRVAASV
jgi:hypothetical protein